MNFFFASPYSYGHLSCLHSWGYHVSAGPARASGISISFVHEEGVFYLAEIEEYIGQSLPRLQLDEPLLATSRPRDDRPKKPRTRDLDPIKKKVSVRPHFVRGLDFYRLTGYLVYSNSYPFFNKQILC